MYTLYDIIEIKKAIIYALGEIQSERAIDTLINMLNDKDMNTIQKATESLGKIGASSILSKIISESNINIYDRDIFRLSKRLATKFNTIEAKRKQKIDFIPVYTELVVHKRK